jgi:hypothetical protein
MGVAALRRGFHAYGYGAPERVGLRYPLKMLPVLLFEIT